MKNSSNRIHQIYSLYLTALSILIGALFIIHILYIYVTRNQPGVQIFTEEVVKKHLSQMIFPMIIYVLSLIGIWIVDGIFPILEKKNIKITSHETFVKMKERIDFKKNEEEFIPLYQKLKKINLIKIISLSSIGIISLVTIILFIREMNLLIGKGFSNEELMLNVVLASIPSMAISIGLLIIYVIVEEFISKKEVVIARELIAKGATKKVSIGIKKRNKYELWIGRGVIFAASVTFLVIGIFSDDVQFVLGNAIKICAGCIGLA